MTSTARLAASPVLSSRRRDFEPSGPGQARFGIRLVLGLDKPRSVWRLLRPAEIRAIDPHPMQDYANLTRQGDLGSFCSTPLGDIHAPAFECGEARDTRQQMRRPPGPIGPVTTLRNQSLQPHFAGRAE